MFIGLAFYQCREKWGIVVMIRIYRIADTVWRGFIGKSTGLGYLHERQCSYVTSLFLDHLCVFVFYFFHYLNNILCRLFTPFIYYNTQVRIFSIVLHNRYYHIRKIMQVILFLFFQIYERELFTPY